MDKRNDNYYVRLLELQSVITEQYGVVVKDINDYLGRGDNSKLEKAEKELQGLKSPIFELEALVGVINRRNESKKN